MSKKDRFTKAEARAVFIAGLPGYKMLSYAPGLQEEYFVAVKNLTTGVYSWISKANLEGFNK